MRMPCICFAAAMRRSRRPSTRSSRRRRSKRDPRRVPRRITWPIAPACRPAARRRSRACSRTRRRRRPHASRRCERSAAARSAAPPPRQACRRPRRRRRDRRRAAGTLAARRAAAPNGTRDDLPAAGHFAGPSTARSTRASRSASRRPAPTQPILGAIEVAFATPHRACRAHGRPHQAAARVGAVSVGRPGAVRAHRGAHQGGARDRWAKSACRSRRSCSSLREQRRGTGRPAGRRSTTRRRASS